MINNEKGLTLVELIISMVLISIISLAAFSGLSYAYHIMLGSEEFIEDTYNEVLEGENVLTYASLGDSYVNIGVALNAYASGNSEVATPIEEDLDLVWANDPSNPSFEGDIYKVNGYRLDFDTEGQQYLAESLKFFVPTIDIDINP